LIGANGGLFRSGSSGMTASMIFDGTILPALSAGAGHSQQPARSYWAAQCCRRSGRSTPVPSGAQRLSLARPPAASAANSPGTSRSGTQKVAGSIATNRRKRVNAVCLIVMALMNLSVIGIASAPHPAAPSLPHRFGGQRLLSCAAPAQALARRSTHDRMWPHWRFVIAVPSAALRR
jgi:hypothetical protein